jgi:hypothetical protein
MRIRKKRKMKRFMAVQKLRREALRMKLRKRKRLRSLELMKIWRILRLE